MQKTIVCFGDSITFGTGVERNECWVSILGEVLKGFKVINAGIGGNTSAEGLARIEKDVLAHMPGLVLVEFGGNDTVHDARAVSVLQFEKNLLTINEKVQAKGGEVIFVTFPPVINEWHAWYSDAYYIKWGGLDGCVEQYREITKKIAKKLNCPLFDLDKLLREKIKTGKKEDYISKDGVHLMPIANRLIADSVLKFIKESTKYEVQRTK